VAWLLPNDYGLELECADVLEHQLEAARQRAYAFQDVINMLRREMQESDASVNKMKQETEEATKKVEILQTKVCAI
jgi:uncharacterized protein involved in exopolysaccharide biosynthesis